LITRTADKKALTDILLDIYEKGEQLQAVDTRDIVSDIVFQLKPFMESERGYD
jgi:hypothetical protein